MADRDPTTRRIALAWRELRRGSTGTVLRDHLVGADGPPLEQAQLDALEILSGEPDGMQMSDLADALRVDPSNATRVVTRLERLGLAARSPADHDRRVVIARATPLGQAVIQRVIRRRAFGMQRLLEPFDEAERVQFADLLERFVAAIDELVDELGHTP